jgi:hypothetical protein
MEVFAWRSVASMRKNSEPPCGADHKIAYINFENPSNSIIENNQEQNMNFEPIVKFATGVVIAAAIAGNLNSLNRWVYVATAKLHWESRTATWGSPHWPEHQLKSNKTQIKVKEVPPTQTKAHSI